MVSWVVCWLILLTQSFWRPKQRKKKKARRVYLWTTRNNTLVLFCFYRLKASRLLWSDGNGEFMDGKMEILSRCTNTNCSVYSVWRAWSHSSWLHEILTHTQLLQPFQGSVRGYVRVTLHKNGPLFRRHKTWMPLSGCVGVCFPPFGGPCAFPALQRATWFQTATL